MISEKTTFKQLQSVFDDLEVFGTQQFNEAPLSLNSVACDKSLNLENNNSLALMARHSIQHGLPIPKNMLSHSEDAFQSQDQSYQQKSPDEPQLKIEAAEDQLIHQLNLTEFVFEKLENTPGENTKNVLRNYGNAQNHYVLYNRKARKYLESNMDNLIPFDEWVRSLKLENFQNFKSAWGPGVSRLFTRVYKKLCWDFYTQNAIPYVLSSRIKKSQTRNSHLRYVYRFLQGLKNPQEFNYFRKT